MIETVAQITAPHFVAGIVLHDDFVVEAAPIVDYMRSRQWGRAQVRSYCKAKGWSVKVIGQKEVSHGDHQTGPGGES